MIFYLCFDSYYIYRKILSADNTAKIFAQPVFCDDVVEFWNKLYLRLPRLNPKKLKEHQRLSKNPWISYFHLEYYKLFTINGVLSMLFYSKNSAPKAQLLSKSFKSPQKLFQCSTIFPAVVRSLRAWTCVNPELLIPTSATWCGKIETGQKIIYHHNLLFSYVYY